MNKQNGKIDHSKGKMPNKDSKDNKNNEFHWKRAGKTSFIWVFLLISAIFLSGLFTSADQKAVEIQYYEYRGFLEDKLITKAIIVEDVLTGEFETPQTIISEVGPIENVKKFPGLGRFLIGRIFYTDAINTLIIFMSIYVTNEFGFTTDTTIWYKNIQYFLLVGVLSSIASGFLWGYIVDIYGPKRTLNLVLYLWFIDFIVVIALALFDVPYADIIIWSGAFLAGISVSGLWVADRPYMLLLTPPKYLF